MTKFTEGRLDAKGLKFAVIVSRFNEFISEKLLSGCLDCLLRHGAAEEAVEVFRVPGSWEIPLVASKVSSSGKYDAVVCLGTLIRGATPHFDFIAREASKGIAGAAMEAGLPVTFGVITADTIEQAVERAGTKSGNKGFEGAMGLVEMCSLYQQIGGLK